MAQPAPIRVLVADDHALLRAELCADLELDGEFVVVAEAENGHEALAAALRERPDVCLLDVNMPRSGGIEAAAAIAGRLPETKIVVLTASRDDDDALQALRAGAVGYLLKDADAEGLTHALRDVLDGGVRFSRPLRSRIVAQLRERDVVDGEERLLRERVLGLLEDGLSAAEMAARLALAPDVVQGQLAGLLGELRVSAAR